MCSDLPPLDVVESHMDREESVPLDGAWNMHVESPWLSRGARALMSRRRRLIARLSILFGSSKKRLRASGFVKKSARFSSLRTM